MKILIVCTGNSCRSQMAEGFLMTYDKSLEIYSAGVKPEEQVNPHAVAVMNEIGIDIGQAKPDDIQSYINQSFDYVITVCDHAFENCPIFTGDVKNRLHIGFEDPAAAKGTEEEIMAVYRNVRDQIGDAFKDFWIRINN